MPDPGFAQPDLCSIRTANEQDELAQAVHGGFSADGYPLTDDDPPAPLASGIDSAIRLSTAAAVARWLLALGIAATLTANMAQGWSHGPVGAVVAAWPAVSLVGSYELLVWLIRTCGAADPRPSAEHLGASAACRAAPHPVPASAAHGERSGGSDRGTSGPAWRPAGQAAGHPSQGPSVSRDGPASLRNVILTAPGKPGVKAWRPAGGMLHASLVP
jgi:hypothetical protein